MSARHSLRTMPARCSEDRRGQRQRYLAPLKLIEPPLTAMADSTPATTPPQVDPPVGGIRITHLRSGLRGTSFTAAGGSLSLGRKTGLEIAFDGRLDFLVSGVHARIFQDEQRAWHIEDSGSTNGTALNGELLSMARRLRTGDVVTLGARAETDGAASFRVEVVGEALPTPRPMGPSVSPFRTSPSEEGPKPVVVPGNLQQAGAHHGGGAQDPDHAVPRQEGGFLGIKRIKGAISRFLDRREVQKQLNGLHSQLPSVRARAEQAAGALGRELWKTAPAVAEALPAKAELALYERECAEAEAQFRCACEELDSATSQFLSRQRQWQDSHSLREVAFQAARTEAADATSRATAADGAVNETLVPFLGALSGVREAIDSVLQKHADPAAGVHDDLQATGIRLQEAASICVAVPASVAELVVERDRWRRLASEAASRAEQASAALVESQAESDADAAGQALREREHEQARAAHAHHLGGLEQHHALAFTHLGQEALRSDAPDIRALGTYATACTAAQALEALEEKIANLQEAIAELA